ncbi:MAG: NAD(P) transhydrogenase subunit alpha [Cellulomonas sp.]
MTAILTVAALTERGHGERRVALVPDTVTRLVAGGFAVLIEAGAGAGAFYPDDEYVAAGAKTDTLEAVLDTADVLLAVRRPEPEILARLRPGQVLVGLLDARGTGRAGLDELVARGVVVLSLDLLPRTLSRAQTMDALSSQASVAGYRAAVVAAEAFARYFPMMITAAGTARPAKVLVLGAGVAGLQAIGTARRLGAQVTGYDVREAAREEVKSLGASFLATTVNVASEGGYARALTPEEQAAQQAELSAKMRAFDIVITTAQVPGARPPVLVTAETLAGMSPGSVVVDLGASSLGGNVDGSVPDERIVTANGVTVIGAGNLPAQMATGASAAYARNVAALLTAVVVDGAVKLDPTDEVVDAVWVRPAAVPSEVVVPAEDVPVEAVAAAGAAPETLPEGE